MAGNSDIVVTSNRLGELARRLPDLTSQIIRKAALDIEAEAKQRAPVDTGALQNSIQALPEGDGSWVVAVGADYGAYVEYGTVTTPAQPYLHPAVDIVDPSLEAAVAAALERL